MIALTCMLTLADKNQFERSRAVGCYAGLKLSRALITICHRRADSDLKR